MAEIPSVPQLYSDIHYARMFLNAASREDDPERQRSLAAIGQGFAQLAQVAGHLARGGTPGQPAPADPAVASTGSWTCGSRPTTSSPVERVGRDP